MLTKRQRMLIFLTLLAVAGAIYTLIWAKQVNTMLENPPLLQKSSEMQPETTTTESLENGLLLSNFDALLSDEQIADLYEGEQDF